MEKSLCERLGGSEAVKAVVKEFYKLVLADATVNKYFVNVKLELLMDSQSKFLVQAFGGQKNYEGTDMVTAHTGMNITDAQFDQVSNHLHAALSTFKVDELLIKEALAIADSQRLFIVGQ